eukprot:gene190-4436_t
MIRLLSIAKKNKLSFVKRKYSKFHEEKYQKMTPLEHVLNRPDAYVGSIQKKKEKNWIFENNKIIEKEIEFSPGLYRILDEIIMNAVDNHHRENTETNILKVNFESEWVHIFNNGKTIPIEIHSIEKIYIPELVFGHLLTGSNFNDEEIKLVGGRNGYGSKLANIFSKEFKIEIQYGLKNYKQIWRDNMKICNEPIINEEKKKKEEYLKVSFTPDFKRFNKKEKNLFTKDFFKLIERRLIDISGCNSKLQIYFNDQRIQIQNLKEYAKLIFEQDTNYLYKKLNENWEIIIGSSLKDNEFKQISFVNSISTIHGGTHVNSILYPLIKLISDNLNSKKLSNHIIKNQITLILNCKIQNPIFDSQTKEMLTSKMQTFDLNSDLYKQINNKTDVIENIKNFTKMKDTMMAERKSKKLIKSLLIPKLEDALYAGGNHSNECTLILTEGDSAKSLAVAGLSVLGREKYGVFPLRGKLLNVRDASEQQILNNEEIKNLKLILGLEENLTYDNLYTKDGKFKLRYGKLILMTDQDFDGSHIKGLIINLFHFYWPNLLKQNFIQVLITPIIKTFLKNETYSFFNLNDFEIWKSNLNSKTNFISKYYKGLGTNTSKESKEYFLNLKKHLIQFYWKDKNDDDSIDMAFSKKRVKDRKDWLNNNQNLNLNFENKRISFTDFINKELIHFSNYDNIRSIPNIMDGLKPGQRKILFSCFKRNLNNEIKVAQLSGYVAEHTQYHHGEISLHSTIINMAQDFVGSNNIPLLYPSGTFGSRSLGGKDAASARYIFTKLNELTRFIFHPDDDDILDYNFEDGDKIEPKYFVPIIPMILVNGCEGVGTGWSTQIPSFNPLDIIENLLNLLQDKDLNEMKMWSKGFKGNIRKEDNKFISEGIIEIGKKGKLKNVLIIKELPLKKWTEDYKQFLISENIKFSEHHSEKEIEFRIYGINEDDINLKLESKFSLNNMILFSPKFKIKKYLQINDILIEFFKMRLSFYKKRKENLIKKLNQELLKLKEKLNFLILQKELDLQSKTKDEIIKKLKDLNFISIQELLNIPILNMTKDNIQKLKNIIEEKEKILNDLQNKNEKDIWKNDLFKLKNKLINIE